MDEDIDSELILDDINKVFNSNVEGMNLHELSEFEEFLWRIRAYTDKLFDDRQSEVDKLIIEKAGIE